MTPFDNRKALTGNGTFWAWLILRLFQRSLPKNQYVETYTESSGGPGQCGHDLEEVIPGSKSEEFKMAGSSPRDFTFVMAPQIQEFINRYFFQWIKWKSKRWRIYFKTLIGWHQSENIKDFERMEELFCFYAEQFKAKRKRAKFWMLFRFVFIFDVQNNNK